MADDQLSEDDGRLLSRLDERTKHMVDSASRVELVISAGFAAFERRFDKMEQAVDHGDAALRAEITAVSVRLEAVEDWKSNVIGTLRGLALGYKIALAVGTGGGVAGIGVLVESLVG